MEPEHFTRPPLPEKFDDLLALAEEGDAEAQFEVGLEFYAGGDVDKDYAEAARWYKRAAEQGYVLAHNALGWMAFRGQGMPEDGLKAFHWFEYAAERGINPSRIGLGYLYEREMLAWGCREDAKKWFLRAVDAGGYWGYECMGRYYHFGPEEERHKAVRWYTEGYKLGCPESAFRLGKMYLEGDGVDCDIDEAEKWLENLFKMGLDRDGPWGYMLRQAEIGMEVIRSVRGGGGRTDEEIILDVDVKNAERRLRKLQDKIKGVE